MFVGEDKVLVFPVVDRETQAVKDITGWTLSWVLSDRQGGTTLATLAGTVTSGAGGIAEVTVPAASTTGLSGGTYWHSLSRTDTASNAVVSFGPIVVKVR